MTATGMPPPRALQSQHTCCDFGELIGGGIFSQVEIACFDGKQAANEVAPD